MRVDLAPIIARVIFNAAHHARLERVSFLKQLVNTLRIRSFDVGQALQIS